MVCPRPFAARTVLIPRLVGNSDGTGDSWRLQSAVFISFVRYRSLLLAVGRFDLRLRLRLTSLCDVCVFFLFPLLPSVICSVLSCFANIMLRSLPSARWASPALLPVSPLLHVPRCCVLSVFHAAAPSFFCLRTATFTFPLFLLSSVFCCDTALSPRLPVLICRLLCPLCPCCAIVRRIDDGKFRVLQLLSLRRQGRSLSSEEASPN